MSTDEVVILGKSSSTDEIQDHHLTQVDSHNSHIGPKTTLELSDAICSETTAYSRINESSLRRGELWLLPNEEEQLNAVLKALNFSSSWAFMEIPDTYHPPLPHHGQKFGTALSSGKKSKRKLASGAYAPKRKSTLANIAPITRPSSATSKEKSYHTGDKETLAQKAARVSQRHLKQLPDWARRLHRITVHLCQSTTVRPFAREALPSDHDYAAIYDAIQPGLTPIGLLSVVSKLQQGGYQAPLEAFNDIYSVWLSAYRIYPPGSPLWLQAYEASKVFQQQVVNEPLRDDFTPAGNQAMGGLEDEEYTGKVPPPSTSRKRRSPSSNANVDKLIQEFFGQHEGAPMKGGEPIVRRTSSGGSWAGASRVKKRSSSQGKRQPKSVQAAQPAANPITDLEREAFQNYLSQLHATHHLMLYEAFRRTAVWRSVESGEVELDDAKTSPPVFRRMIAWCRSQLAVQLPQSKKQRTGSMETATNEATGFVGSGKTLPGVEVSSGGKLGARNILESKPSESLHARYLSSSSSSSSSKSSDEDDESSSDEDAAPVSFTPQVFKV